MNDLPISSTEHYRIRLKGHLALHWSEWFDGLTITHLDNGETELYGLVIDQAALHGMLNHIRDLGLPLLAVDRVEPKKVTHNETRTNPPGKEPATKGGNT